MGTSGLQVGRLVTNWNSEGGGKDLFRRAFRREGKRRIFEQVEKGT